MPFTLSHAAAVLPLFRGPLVPAALVAGSMAPDVPYFLRAAGLPVAAGDWWEPLLNGTTSHGWPGAAQVALPVGLALYVAYRLARRPLGALTPDGRAPLTPPSTPAALAAVVASAALGVLTHLLWDSFTHTDGWFVQHLEPLQRPAAAGQTWVRVLQHLSTVLGLLALAAWSWRRRSHWLARRGTAPARRQRLALAAAAVAAAVGAVLATARWWDGPRRWFTTGQFVEVVVSDAAKGAGVALVVLAAAAVATWWVRRALDATPRRVR